MSLKNRLFKISALALLMSGFLAVGVFGQEPVFKPVADEVISSGGITWIPKVNYSLLGLTIARPDGTLFEKTFEAGSTPNVDISDILGKSYLDGSYIYELRATTETKPQRREGDFVEVRYSTAPLLQTGGFSVLDGRIVNPDEKEPDADKGASRSIVHDGLSGAQDFVIADDLIVIGSACIGFDCVNGESFSFDTLRFKEHNLRIKFDDTSTIGSFPRNDWQLTANSSANGGASKFSIDDITNSRTPFTVEANARSNSLYVDDGGRIGIRTSTPALEIHVVDGDTPGLRLQQDSSAGFAPQTWDVSGNETNFFVRDATNGSQLPFKIRPGADSNSLVIDGDGDIGIGVGTPSFPLHLRTDSSSNAAIVAERTGGATNFMNATATQGVFGTTTNHTLRFVVNSLFQMDLVGNSDIVMQDGGGYNGTWNPASSRELKENITDLTRDEAMVALEGLKPVKYNYKADKEEPRVGFIAEDVPELVAMKGRKTLGTVDIVAVLTKVIKEQHESQKEQQQMLEAQQKTLKDQQEIISRLTERVAELEKDTN
jgi:hypothetical protein